MTMNWVETPARMANLLCTCSRRWDTSTVADMPKMRRKRRAEDRIWASTSNHDEEEEEEEEEEERWRVDREGGRERDRERGFDGGNGEVEEEEDDDNDDDNDDENNDDRAASASRDDGSEELSS
mmetsp:Transcript_27021/g.55835  ORF Transcript_27021/g.55835 Transcript_27021/m.55835 type:complete len:124 (-) Transcript_27021:100-471(-)